MRRTLLRGMSAMNLEAMHLMTEARCDQLLLLLLLLLTVAVVLGMDLVAIASHDGSEVYRTVVLEVSLEAFFYVGGESRVDGCLLYTSPSPRD